LPRTMKFPAPLRTAYSMPPLTFKPFMVRTRSHIYTRILGRVSQYDATYVVLIKGQSLSSGIQNLKNVFLYFIYL
jgi:hypothetical protein